EHGRSAADPAGDNLRYQRMRRWMAPFINRYVAVSPDLRYWLVERVGIRQSKVVYIAYGVDTERFHMVRARSGARDALGDLPPAGTLLIGKVAGLDEVKDHAGLIRAFQLLRADDHSADYRLLIVGGGPQRDELERQIEILGLAGVV